MIDSVSRNVRWSMSCAPSSSSARAQSIDSAIDGGFLRSSSRTMAITSTTRRATGVGSSGAAQAGPGVGQLRRVQVDDLQLALRGGVVEPQIQATALQRLRELARVVRR